MLLSLEKIVVSEGERAVLLDELSNWNKLHEVLSRETKPEKIEKLIKVETTSRKRMVICTRLLYAYGRLARAENSKNVIRELSKESKPEAKTTSKPEAKTTSKKPAPKAKS